MTNNDDQQVIAINIGLYDLEYNVPFIIKCCSPFLIEKAVKDKNKFNLLLNIHYFIELYL